jgi:HK97 gp10 family phage protein
MSELKMTRVVVEELDAATIADSLEIVTAAVAAAAQRLAPVRTGTLRNSITATVIRNFEPKGVVEATAPYALFVHNGTGIYGPRGRPIVPVRARVLAFPGRDGRMVFARSVRGQRPQPFLTNALHEVLGR